MALQLGAIGQAAPFRGAPINGASGIEVSYGAGGLVQVPIIVTNAVAGMWHYDVSIENPDATLWTSGAVTPNDSQLQTGATEVHFPLTLMATAPSSEQRYLVFVAKRQDTDGVGQISNFLRIPIRGD